MAWTVDVEDRHSGERLTDPVGVLAGMGTVLIPSGSGNLESAAHIKEGFLEREFLIIRSCWKMETRQGVESVAPSCLAQSKRGRSDSVMFDQRPERLP